jgi:predicted lactoylglutathione lyase
LLHRVDIRRPIDKGVIVTKVFVNLPTSDLERSKAFYTAIGCDINPLFTDENAACVVWSDDIYFMILKTEFFATFTDKPIADPNQVVQVSVSFAQDSREDVDAIVEKALAAGGTEPKPAQDYGFMYSRDIDDPDGNSLGFLYMTPEAAENGPEHVEAH